MSSLAEILSPALAASPDAEALVVLTDGGATLRWTYRELDAEVARRARALRTAGVGGGDAVLLVAARTAGLVPTVLALLRLGAAYVPVDPAAPDSRWRLVADAVAARATIGRSADLTRARSALAPGTLLLDVDDLPGMPEPAPDGDVDPSAIAYVLFTSGSTGTPKGVLVSHGNVTHRVASYLDLTDGPCRYLLHSSLCFDGAVGGLFSTLARGGCLVLVPDAVAADPGLAAGVVRAERVTHLEPVPSWYDALLDLARPGDLDSVRVVILGGEVLPAALVAASQRALPQARLFNDYGPTEVTVAATVFAVPTGWTGADVPIGRPHVNTEVAVLDEARRPVPAGEVGELWVGGPCVAQGYLGAPSHPAFHVDPVDGGRWYRTGDLAARDSDGLLHFHGRRDRQVKIRGQRIEPEEVEAVLRALPDVQAAAVEVDNAGPEARLVGYAAPRPGRGLTQAALAEQLAERLPLHLRPSALVVLPSLPLTAGGKVDRAALPAAARDDGTAAGDAPTDPLEREIAEVFTAVLGRTAGRDTDFFAAGGQSLGAARVVARLRSGTGRDVGLADLTATPTPAQLAAVLRDRPRTTEPVLRRRPRPAGDVWRVPAAPRQESFWYLEHVPHGRGRSNLVEVLTFPEGTDPDLLRGAVRTVVERHAALRTGFDLSPQGLVQVVRPHARPDVVDLAPAVDGPALDALADAFGAEPFDLSAPPLLRAGVTASPEGPALVLVVHHAVADGWSLGLLVEELTAIVAARGDGASLPEPAIEYADLVEWTADRSPERRAAAEEHLTGLLERGAATGARTLPFDRPPAARPDGAVGVVRSGLSAATLTAVARLAGAAGTTVYAVLTASFGALLARLSDQPEVVLSGPLSGRGDPALDRVVGCCINTGLFPVDVSGAPSFADLLGRVAAEAAAASAHTWLPLEVPMRRLDEGQRATVAPVLFNLLEARDHAAASGGGQAQRRSRPSAMAYSALDLYLEHRDGGLAIEAVYLTDRLERATVERLLDRWLRLLDAVLARPDAPVRDLPVLTPAEEELLDRLEGAPGEPCTTTVLAEFRARAAEEPGAVAVLDGSGPWTRAQLWDRAGAIAVLLAGRGVAPGDTVVLALDETADAIAALLACWRSGAVPVPVGEGQPAGRVDAIAASCGAALVVDRGLLGQAGEAARWDDVPPRPDTPAYVLYTSGSTGEPKGVVVGSAALAASTRARVRAYPERPPVALVAHDLAFDAGLGIVSWYLWTGGALVMASHDERLDPHLLAALLHRHGVGQLDIVPSHYRLLLDLADPEQLAGLTLVTLGGEACPPSLVAQHRAVLPGAALVNEYGPTESTVWALAHTCTGADASAAHVPIGRPIDGVVARVADAAGRRLPPGADGELLLAGHLLADGYLGDPAHTADRFVQQDGRRWYRTGDRARWNAQGEVEFLGRLDQQLKVRGVRVEPGEVETVLAALDGVGRAAVDVVEVVEGSPVLVAWVQPTAQGAAGGRLDPAALRETMLAVLPEWLVPQTVLVVDELPETTAGKIDRARLPRPDTNPGTGGPCETETERRVAAIWSDLLDRPVGADVSFFALGGQSLLAARMVARVRDELGGDIDLRDVLAAPRVRDIAALVDGRARPAGSPVLADPLDPGHVDGLLDVGDVDGLLDRVDELDDDEVEALLARLDRS